MACFSCVAKDLPLGGKPTINHDYTCLGVSTGRSAIMTVQETQGIANTLFIAENSPKPLPVTLTAIDDQTRVARLYKLKAPNGSTEILQISGLTKMATVTMLNTLGLEAFTSFVCNENE